MPAPTLQRLALPVVMAPAGLSCADLDDRFRADPALPCVAVRYPGGGVGLITRQAFGHLMSGPYGFGRALWSTTPVGAVADRDPLVLPVGTPVVQACERLQRREPAHRYDDVLALAPGGRLSRVPAASLFEALARLMGEQLIRDPLSGLANRAHFLERLESACRDAADTAGRRPLVVFLDLDHMKQVNDALGHNAGDRLIVSTAQRLTGAAHRDELVARLGGDEFAVLSHAPVGAGPEAGWEVGERFRGALARRDSRLAPEAHSSASVGVAVSGSRPDGHTLLTEADMAMYRAKQAGGNTVRVVLDVDDGLAERHPGAGRGVVRAIETEQLRLFYQPIVDLAAGRVISVEALVRWLHPRQGLLPPGRFLPDVERAGELRTLDAWVLGRACADLAIWDAALGRGAPRHVNVNITTDTLQADDVDTEILAVVGRNGLEPSRLRIELPETADLTALTDAAARLTALRERGVGITLDDMGAGSSTLRHLSALPISGLKIDKSFIHGMLSNRGDHAVIRLLTDLGHALGVPVTAEGVETGDQVDALRGMGVPYAQGFHLGRPATAEKLVASLRRGRHAAQLV